MLRRPGAARVHSPTGYRLGYAGPEGEVCVVDRGVFDRSLARETVASGAEIVTGARAVDVRSERRGVAGRRAGMWLMLRQEAPADLVFGTGHTHSVREFVEAAFGYVKLDWRDSVSVDPRYFRPTEVETLQADPSEATRRLGWEARVTVRDLMRVMVDAELDTIRWPVPGDGTRGVTDGRLGWLGRP